MPRKHFYEDVPGLGNVAVSRHAQGNMDRDRISQEAFERVLLSPSQPDVPDGINVVWRERDRIRIVVVLNPEPPRGAKLITTVYRVKPQEHARRR